MTSSRRPSSRRVRRDMPSPRIPYEDFRTGLSFAEVRRMLWVYSSDPKDWRYKRRGTVLGLWHQIKKELYARYLDAIDLEREAMVGARARKRPRDQARSGRSGRRARQHAR